MDFPPFSQLKEKFVTGFEKTVNGLRGDSLKLVTRLMELPRALMGLLLHRVLLQKSLQGRNLHPEVTGVS